MLDCWKADPELRPSFSFLKHKVEEMIRHSNQAYPYVDFDLNDYLPYCTLRLTSEAFSSEDILDEHNKQGVDDEKENSGTEDEKEETNEEIENNPIEIQTES